MTLILTHPGGPISPTYLLARRVSFSELLGRPQSLASLPARNHVGQQTHRTEYESHEDPEQGLASGSRPVSSHEPQKAD